MRDTVALVATAVGREIPSAQVCQVTPTKLWLQEHGEPFCIVSVLSEVGVSVEMSVHCAPDWAAVLVAALTHCGLRVTVVRNVFIQTDSGSVLHGPDAEGYWRQCLHHAPLVSQRFVAPAPYPI